MRVLIAILLLTTLLALQSYGFRTKAQTELETELNTEVETEATYSKRVRENRYSVKPSSSRVDADKTWRANFLTQCRRKKNINAATYKFDEENYDNVFAEYYCDILYYKFDDCDLYGSVSSIFFRADYYLWDAHINGVNLYNTMDAVYEARMAVNGASITLD